MATEIRVNGSTMPGDAETLMTPGEVAEAFRVDPHTARRWGRQGKLTLVRTPGGHVRFREAEVRALLNPGSEK